MLSEGLCPSSSKPRGIEGSRKPSQHAIQDELLDMEMELDLPVLPKGEIVPEEDGWLYDSGRSYFDQLATYKHHQNGGAA